MQTRVCRLHAKNNLRIDTLAVAETGADEVLVAIGAGGICGSDLHYFHDGGFGQIRVQEPIILGHEVAGTVLSIGAEVTTLEAGDRVALNPSRPCGHCTYCVEGLKQHCLNMRFFGSAMRFPHEQGAFRDRMVVRADQCEKIGPQTSLAEAACAEPLAVCLHAGNRAGDLQGRRVLVTGAGPIGALCTAVARHGDAAEIVVTDLHDFPLDVARQMGATQTVNVQTAPDGMAPYILDKGYFDIVFECSAAPSALRTAIAAVRPQGRIVQVGVTGDLPLPINLIVGKEISIVGSHRFDSEYAQAVRLIDNGEIAVKRIISQTFPIVDAAMAFATASDRAQAVKVQLAFD